MENISDKKPQSSPGILTATPYTVVSAESLGSKDAEAPVFLCPMAEENRQAAPNGLNDCDAATSELKRQAVSYLLKGVDTEGPQSAHKHIIICPLHRAEETQRAFLNILEDFDTEKSRLERTQKATFNILEDFNTEKLRLEDTQRAVLNILEDFSIEKNHLEGTQRATLNILEDFNAEKLRLEDTQRAVLNILEDFDVEKTKVEEANRLLKMKSDELNRSNEELELRIEERTADLRQSNAQLRAEMEERKKAEERVKASLVEKEALLREIHHRVKNNLQIIRSMLNLQLPQVRDEQSIQLFKESQNRIYTMALIHEKLYQSESMAAIDLPEYIRSLTANLFQSYGVAGHAIRPIIDVEPVSLDVDTAIPCALIINELVSNSLKHAFPSSRSPERGGEVHIDLHRGDKGKLILSVSDNGIGLSPGFEIRNCRSLGLKLVCVLAKQIGGTVDVSTGGGARISITFAARRGIEG